MAPDPHAEAQPSRNLRVKADVEWPKFDSSDLFYSIEEFFDELERVMMLVGGGAPWPPQERLEMLRGTLSATPLLGFKAFVDDDADRNAIVKSGTKEQREAQWEEVKAHFFKGLP